MAQAVYIKYKEFSNRVDNDIFRLLEVCSEFICINPKRMYLLLENIFSTAVSRCPAWKIFLCILHGRFNFAYLKYASKVMSSKALWELSVSTLILKIPFRSCR